MYLLNNKHYQNHIKIAKKPIQLNVVEPTIFGYYPV